MGVKTRNLGNSEGKDIQWQAPLNADGSTIFNLEAGKGYFINTTGGEVELKLPTGSLGDRIQVMDFAGTFATNCIRLNLNGQNLAGSNNPSGVANQQNYVKIETDNARIELVFSDSEKGWVVFENEAKTSPTGAPFVAYIEATGGTVTESGDFKIHTFTGDGCFVVSNAGNAGGSDQLEYLVVAGGGSGGSENSQSTAGGGGGAGGFRFASPSIAPLTYPAKPLAGSTLTAAAQTYPVTVGGGGAGGCTTASGSNSVFSTITSAGGGGGGFTGGASPQPRAGVNGGSGGGSSHGETTPTGGGAGNTPPVSPPQGNNGGGKTSPGVYLGGGGGGATAAGTDGGNQTGPGGDGGGLPTAFGSNGVPCGSYRYYAGGGGGGGSTNRPQTGPAGTGGKGGGAAGGAGQNDAPSAATANSGGGGGGAGNRYPSGPTLTGSSGGKGIVVVRYKFQN